MGNAHTKTHTHTHAHARTHRERERENTEGRYQSKRETRPRKNELLALGLAVHVLCLVSCRCADALLPHQGTSSGLH